MAGIFNLQAMKWIGIWDIWDIYGMALLGWSLGVFTLLYGQGKASGKVSRLLLLDRRYRYSHMIEAI